MIEIYERLPLPAIADADVLLPLTHDQREKARLKTRADSGDEVRVFLERGKVLKINEYLVSRCGKSVKVVGYPEEVTIAFCDDWQTFATACYHLGNRHVRLEVGNRWLQMKPDHVLEEMLVRLGLTVAHKTAVFNPESGAYSGGHNHGHSVRLEHKHPHHQDHSHSHGHHHHD
jgi:urease accessory protein